VLGSKDQIGLKMSQDTCNNKPEKFIDLLMKPENMLQYDEIQTEVRTIILAVSHFYLFSSYNKYNILN
jgi:hypothetical protein